jgi:predicted amidohydrolase YtcJ
MRGAGLSSKKKKALVALLTREFEDDPQATEKNLTNEKELNKTIRAIAKRGLKPINTHCLVGSNIAP